MEAARSVVRDNPGRSYADVAVWLREAGWLNASKQVVQQAMRPPAPGAQTPAQKQGRDGAVLRKAPESTLSSVAAPGPEPADDAATAAPVTPSPEPEDAPADLETGAIWISRGDRPGQTIRWRIAFRHGYRSDDWCPLPRANLWQQYQFKEVVLSYRPRRGRPETSITSRRLQITERDGDRGIRGISWPNDLQPGVLVTFTWSIGRRQAAARSGLLAEPHSVNGVVYHHSYDAKVLVRVSVERLRSATTLTARAWVLRTLRVCGYLDRDGTATLAADALVTNCRSLGCTSSEQELLNALAGLHREKVLTTVQGSVDTLGLPSHPQRPGDRKVQLLRYAPQIKPFTGQADATATPGNVRDHEVSGFVRRLPSGQRASDEALANHEAAVLARKVVKRHLGPNETFVQDHKRGGHARRT